MARTVIDLPLRNQDIDEIMNVINNILYRYGYVSKNVKGESLWGKGDGFFIPMKCFSICFTENSLIVQGWLRDIIFGEVDLEGLMLAVPKRNMKSIMEEIRLSVARC